MFNIDRPFFFDGYRANFGSLTQSQVDGINTILTSMEADEQLIDPRWAADMLATVKRECGDTWRPIRESSRGKNMKYGRRDAETGQIYYGRGYVQLTWRDNYAEMGRIFEVDLVHNPDLTLNPSLAYRIMSYGMRHGSFTGVGLKKYINADKCDYLNARKIINGLDCAEMIAGYARAFEGMLKEAA